MAKIRLMLTGIEKDLVAKVPYEKEIGRLQISVKGSIAMAKAVLPLVVDDEMLEVRVWNKKKERWEVSWAEGGKASEVPTHALLESKQPQAKEKPATKLKAGKKAELKVVPPAAKAN